MENLNDANYPHGGYSLIKTLWFPLLSSNYFPIISINIIDTPRINQFYILVQRGKFGGLFK